MTIENKHGFYSRQGLTAAELAEIKILADICEAYEQLHMKLNWDTLRSRPQDQTNDFLYYEHGTLVGFLAFFSFNSLEGEVSGMVHPEHRRKGIFTQLFTGARVECQRRNIPTLLLIVEHNSQSGQGFAAFTQARISTFRVQNGIDRGQDVARTRLTLALSAGET